MGWRHAQTYALAVAPHDRCGCQGHTELASTLIQLAISAANGTC